MAETTTGDLIALLGLALHQVGHMANALDAGHRCAAELHHDTRHIGG
jgi:hypothetical protein